MNRDLHDLLSFKFNQCQASKQSGRRPIRPTSLLWSTVWFRTNTTTSYLEKSTSFLSHCWTLEIIQSLYNWKPENIQSLYNWTLENIQSLYNFLELYTAAHWKLYRVYSLYNFLELYSLLDAGNYSLYNFQRPTVPFTLSVQGVPELIGKNLTVGKAYKNKSFLRTIMGSETDRLDTRGHFPIPQNTIF